MNIRNAEINDLPRIMEIFAHARRFMAEHGNPDQWGPDNWPPEDLIRFVDLILRDLVRGAELRLSAPAFQSGSQDRERP